MGLFSKKPKPDPKIKFEGVEFTFHRTYEWWEFTYRGTEFSSHDLLFELQTKAELDSILSTLETLMPEFKMRVEKGLKEWSETSLGDGVSYSVDLTNPSKDGSYSVSWSGGEESWGDMAVDFTIKDHKIIDESWGD